MSRILIAWELGSGLGHVGPQRAIGTELVRRGHSVKIAAANHELTRQAFAGTGVESVAASTLPYSTKRLKFPCTYSDILQDCGYSSVENLTTAVRAWLHLFDDFRPDLLLADHSPTALLASQTRDFATATLGTGFLCPPDISPLPSLRSDIPDPHWAAEVERTVLANMNTALAEYGCSPLARVTEIFGRADRQYLLTLRALDHYGRWRNGDPRPAEYWPPMGTLPGEICDWPKGPGIPDRPRVFAYLRKKEALLPILQHLARRQFPTICYAPHLNETEAESFAGTSVVVCRMPVDINHLASQSDAAVLHGGNATVCKFLQSGVPLLVLPLHLEQRITAERLAELHVGLHASLDDPPAAIAVLEVLLADASYKKSAENFASNVGPLEEDSCIAKLVDDMQRLMASS